MNERLPQVSAQKKLRIHHCLSWRFGRNTATPLQKERDGHQHDGGGSTRPAGEVLSNGDCDDPGWLSQGCDQGADANGLLEAARYCRYVTQIFR